jgi:hypothetical protein
MKTIWRKYPFVYIVILLCVCASLVPSTSGVIPERTIAAHNDPIDNQSSPITSIICGYVSDSSTGDPLENVIVYETWRDPEGNYHTNMTQTGSTGFYLFQSAPEVTFHLSFNHYGYFLEYTPYFYIGENEVFWYNVSLIPYPPVTVHFYGFITDDVSGEPIEGADILLYWQDTAGHSWSNSTKSNSSGFYSIGAIPGRTQIMVRCENYFTFYSQEYVTQDNSTVWLNVSLIPYPPVSAQVCGFITDAQTGSPIRYANVVLYCYTQYGYFHNTTYTTDIGFFSIGTIPGNIRIYVYKQGYTSSSSNQYDIAENQTLWVNLSMEYQPDETSSIKGYVIDKVTSGVVRNAFVRFDWKDDLGHFYSRYTFTDPKGYYSMNVPQGSVQFLVTANGYSNHEVSWFTINDHAELWFNTSLSPEIALEIVKPRPGLYINNESKLPIVFRLISRFFPKMPSLVIGPIEITVNITQSTLGCNRVEFYIDDILEGTDSTAPFTWYWTATGVSKHIIRIIAYDNAGPCDIQTITVRKLR